MSNPPSDALMVSPSEPWQFLGWQKTRVRKKEGGIHSGPLENQRLEPPPKVTEADGSDVHFSFVNFFH